MKCTDISIVCNERYCIGALNWTSLTFDLTPTWLKISILNLHTRLCVTEAYWFYISAKLDHNINDCNTSLLSKVKKFPDEELALYTVLVIIEDIFQGKYSQIPRALCKCLSFWPCIIVSVYCAIGVRDGVVTLIHLEGAAAALACKWKLSFLSTEDWTVQHWTQLNRQLLINSSSSTTSSPYTHDTAVMYR